MTITLPFQFTATVSMLKSAFSALIAGSRTIPLGDNSAVIKELAASSGRRAATGGNRDPFRKA